MDKRRLNDAIGSISRNLPAFGRKVLEGAKRVKNSPVWGKIGRFLVAVRDAEFWGKARGWITSTVLSVAGRKPSLHSSGVSASPPPLPKGKKPPPAVSKVRLNDTDPSLPPWPDLYKVGDEGYLVSGHCKSLASDELIYVPGCLAMIFVPMIVGAALGALLSEKVMNEATGPIIFLGILAGAAWIVYFRYFYGKKVAVAFSKDKIYIKGSQLRLDDSGGVTFRLRPHQKVRLRKRVRTTDEAEKLQNYQDVYLEYGSRSILICGIANLDQAEMFVRLLGEGFQRSQQDNFVESGRMETGTHPPVNVSDWLVPVDETDPDDLPE